MSRRLTAIDVHDLARNERGLFEVEDPVDDVARLADPAHGVKVVHALVGGRLVQGGFGHPEGYGIDPHAPRCVLDRPG
jgi:hypothetical protein